MILSPRHGSTERNASDFPPAKHSNAASFSPFLLEIQQTFFPDCSTMTATSPGRRSLWYAPSFTLKNRPATDAALRRGLPRGSHRHGKRKGQASAGGFCDGLGDCLPKCPTGAITFVRREAPAYYEAAGSAVQSDCCSPASQVQTSRTAGPLQNFPIQVKLPTPSALLQHTHWLLAPIAQWAPAQASIPIICPDGCFSSLVPSWI